MQGLTGFLKAIYNNKVLFVCRNTSWLKDLTGGWWELQLNCMLVTFGTQHSTLPNHVFIHIF